MPEATSLRRGDYVWMERDGERMQAFVAYEGHEAGGQSLIVMFDGMFCRYVGMMPLGLDDDGVFRDLMGKKPINVEKINPGE
jgi:hypothetical protein